jgi:hypothetical protein
VEKFQKIFRYATVIACCGGGIYLFINLFASNESQTPGSIFIMLPIMAMLLFVGGFIAAHSYLQRPCENLVGNLIWKREMLREAPPIVSKVHALAKQGQLEEALQLAAEHHRRYPASPELADLCSELLLALPERRSEAFAVIEAYFARRAIVESENNLPMLFRAADLGETTGRTAEAAALLRRELHRTKTYSDADRRLLRQRLDSILQLQPPQAQ